MIDGHFAELMEMRRDWQKSPDFQSYDEYLETALMDARRRLAEAVKREAKRKDGGK